MVDNPQLDDALATFTDRLRAGEDSQPPPELEELAAVVRQLHRLVPPDSAPRPDFRERLTQRLNREWTVQHKPRRAFPWRTNRLSQVAALAAVMAVVLFAVALITTSDADGSVTGTAVGSTAGAVALVVMILGAIGLLAVWLSNRRRL